jgi:hypothetical protein
MRVCAIQRPPAYAQAQMASSAAGHPRQRCRMIAGPVGNPFSTDAFLTAG